MKHNGRNNYTENHNDAEGEPDSKTEEGQGRGGLGIGFPIIVIGASTGGLEAIGQFFRSRVSDTGMAFIILSHLDPIQLSILEEMLKRITEMIVIEVAGKMVVEPDHIYVIPRNGDMTFFKGMLRVRISKLKWFEDAGRFLLALSGR